jgi:hypothetical protein
MDPGLYTGRSAQQVDRFLEDCIHPVLSRYATVLQEKKKSISRYDIVLS